MKIPAEVLAILQEVLNCANARTIPAYLVGGVIRDHILGIPSLDFDLAFEGDAPAIGEEIAQRYGGKLTRYEAFLTAKLEALPRCPGLEIDFATARTEHYLTPGALPVVQPASIREDLKRRDFTVNALAITLEEYLDWVERVAPISALQASCIDLFAGQADLDQGRILTLHPASFEDDPTRIFRAARYVTRLNGSVEAKTEAQLHAAIAQGALRTISRTRKLNEFMRIVEGSSAKHTFALLVAWKLLSEFDLVPAAEEPRFITHCNTLFDLRSQPEWQTLATHTTFDLILRISAALQTEVEWRTRLARFGYGKKLFRVLRDDLAAIELDGAALLAHQTLLQAVLR
jgi:tRNA nucleotidyltransferase (CCA-adding enzyme)